MSSGDWRFLISDEAVEFFTARRADERRRILKLIGSLCANPSIRPEFSLPDEAGREISFVTREGFQIGFWLDHFVKEVRVVDLGRSN